MDSDATFTPLISNPSNPQYSGIVSGTNGYILENLDVYENFLAVAAHEDGVFFYDISNPSNPEHIYTLNTVNAWAVQMEAFPDHPNYEFVIYIADGETIYTVSYMYYNNNHSFSPIDNIFLNSAVKDIAYSNGLVYFAKGTSGVDIYQTEGTLSFSMNDYDYTFDADYQYYISRKDKIVLNRDKTLNVIEGVSDKVPQLPVDDDDAMTLYNLEIPAYTFNSDDVKVNYVENKRFTMRDVGKLERRIENLEYYVSLSLLEKEADGLVITDANNNDRFKNGILVDPFAGHSVGDVFNDDYAMSIDFDKKHLRPSFNSDFHSLNFN